MGSVGLRELTRNPQAVVRRVLDTGESLEIMTHGRPTGVRLVPDAPARRAWVRGSDLGRIRPMGRDASGRLRDDLADMGGDGPMNPCDPRA